jgi:hypothetical protein
MIRNNPVFHGHNHIRSGYVPTLSISPESLNIAAGGAIEFIAVDVADETQEWSYDIDVAWITMDEPTLIGDDSSIRTFIDPQLEGEQPPRTGHVTFSSQFCADKVLTVQQQARIG